MSCTFSLCSVWAIVVDLGRTLGAQVLCQNAKDKGNERERCVDE